MKLSKLIINYILLALTFFIEIKLILLSLFFSLSKTSKNKRFYIFYITIKELVVY